MAPVTTDGPFPETKELAAGWFMIDVESEGAGARGRGLPIVRARQGRAADL